MSHGIICHDYDEKRENKRISVVQPVRSGEAVPYKVYGIYAEAEKQYREKHGGTHLLLLCDCGRHIIKRNGDEREQTAVYHRESRRTHRVIGAGQELDDEVKKIKPQRKTVRGI